MGCKKRNSSFVEEEIKEDHKDKVVSNPLERKKMKKDKKTYKALSIKPMERRKKIRKALDKERRRSATFENEEEPKDSNK